MGRGRLRRRRLSRPRSPPSRRARRRSVCGCEDAPAGSPRRAHPVRRARSSRGPIPRRRHERRRRRARFWRRRRGPEAAACRRRGRRPARRGGWPHRRGRRSLPRAATPCSPQNTRSRSPSAWLSCCSSCDPRDARSRRRRPRRHDRRPQRLRDAAGGPPGRRAAPRRRLPSTLTRRTVDGKPLWRCRSAPRRP